MTFVLLFAALIAVAHPEVPPPTTIKSYIITFIFVLIIIDFCGNMMWK